MINKICEKEKCTGCSACAQICPKNCIEMLSDTEGFLRPSVSAELCVDCGLCRKICPVDTPAPDDGDEPKACAARHKDDDIRNRSSSGGVFSELAMQILSRGGAVIAAGFDECNNVVHKVCTDAASLDELRRSKYVQSDIHGTFREAKFLLENGRDVLFCGTPCQVGGIKAFLGKEYSNLYTVDFICHGVPSPKAWSKYLEFREEQAQSKAKHISFRSKTVGWKNFSMEIQFDNGTQFSQTVREDMYLRSFIMDMDLRPSCYQCQFKQVHRVSDITLADFWGAEKIGNRWNDDKGVSLALVHSERGQKLLDLCSDWVETIPVSFDEAVASNPSMTKSVKRPPLRKIFMRDIQKVPFNEVHGKYCGTGFGARIRRKLAKLMYK